MEQWRLLDTGPRPAAENMALDEVLLESRSEGKSPNTFRFLQFSHPAVLVGHHQSVEEEVRLNYCRARKIEINRRLTGGGALYWGTSELGWEIYVSKNHPAIPSRIEDLYRIMGEASANGLRRLGLKAHFRPRNDVEVGGRKISGMGGTELSGAILFQGTLLIDFEVDEMLKALRIPTEKLQDKEIQSVKERVTCIRWELGKSPSLNQIKEALIKGFEEVLKARFIEGSLTSEENDQLHLKLPYFLSPEYIFKIREPLPRQRRITSLFKAPGGFIRISMVVDQKSRIIRQILITGDFFVYPRRAIYDLESLLKNSKAVPSHIKENIECFFYEKKPVIPGVQKDHFVHALVEAVQKLDLLPYGFEEEETNLLFPVIKPILEVKKPEVLLLPYCAKERDCELRYQKGCEECGRCSVGEAFAMARRFKMDSITIQSYEDLESTLQSLKRSKVRGFVGSCCEPFFGKHRPDFERIGLPGILVDLQRTTCYELGKEKEAHQGRFENQTSLNLPLLQRILELVHG